MSVGVLLLTHEAMGAALVGAARHVLGKLSLPLDVIEVDSGADPDCTLSDAARQARGLDKGEGVLVLTDLYKEVAKAEGISVPDDDMSPFEVKLDDAKFDPAKPGVEVKRG